MRFLLPLVFVTLGLLVPACGGGSTGSPASNGSSEAVAPLAPDYRALFDVEAVVRFAGIPLPITVDGTMTIENEGVTVAWPGDPARRGWRLTQTIVLDVPAILKLQAPDLPDEVTITVTDFVEIEDDGTWTSLGSEVVDPREEPAETQTVWWASPWTLLEPTLATSQVIENPETDALAEDFATVLGSRSGSRVTDAATVDLDTALGRLTCYRSVLEERVRSTEPGLESLDLTYTRWEHPQLGLVRLHAEGYEFEGEYEGQPVQITVDALDAWIRSRDP